MNPPIADLPHFYGLVLIGHCNFFSDAHQKVSLGLQGVNADEMRCKVRAFFALPKCCPVMWGITLWTSARLQVSHDCLLQSRACQKIFPFSSLSHFPRHLREFDWCLPIAYQATYVVGLWGATPIFILFFFFFPIFNSAIASSLVLFRGSLCQRGPHDFFKYSNCTSYLSGTFFTCELDGRSFVSSATVQVRENEGKIEKIFVCTE